MLRVLFVCSGDTCRSAMASAIMKNKINNKNIKGLSCSSSGLFVSEEKNMNEKAKLALKLLKVPVPNHQATQLTEEILKSNNLVLTMTSGQKQTIINKFPEINFVYSIDEFVGGGDILDPYGKSEAEYYKVASYLEIVVEKILERIIKIGDRLW